MLWLQCSSFVGSDDEWSLSGSSDEDGERAEEVSDEESGPCEAEIQAHSNPSLIILRPTLILVPRAKSKELLRSRLVRMTR